MESGFLAPEQHLASTDTTIALPQQGSEGPSSVEQYLIARGNGTRGSYKPFSASACDVCRLATVSPNNSHLLIQKLHYLRSSSGACPEKWRSVKYVGDHDECRREAFRPSDDFALAMYLCGSCKTTAWLSHNRYVWYHGGHLSADCVPARRSSMPVRVREVEGGLLVPSTPASGKNAEPDGEFQACGTCRAGLPAPIHPDMVVGGTTSADHEEIGTKIVTVCRDSECWRTQLDVAGTLLVYDCMTCDETVSAQAGTTDDGSSMVYISYHPLSIAETGWGVSPSAWPRDQPPPGLITEHDFVPPSVGPRSESPLFERKASYTALGTVERTKQRMGSVGAGQSHLLPSFGEFMMGVEHLTSAHGEADSDV